VFTAGLIEKEQPHASAPTASGSLPLGAEAALFTVQPKSVAAPWEGTSAAGGRVVPSPQVGTSRSQQIVRLARVRVVRRL